MDKRDAFKLGFLAKIAEANLTPGEFQTLAEEHQMRKTAAGTWAAVAGAGKDVLKSLGQWAPYVLLGVPAAAGAFTGYIHSQAADVSRDDVTDYKNRQLIEMLKERTRQIKEQVAYEKANRRKAEEKEDRYAW